MKQIYILEKLKTYIIYTAILFFFIAFNFQDSKTGGWYQQFLPNPLGGQLKDIYFVDSLLGFAVSDSCILKTTNGGDNWSIKLYSSFFTRIRFLDNNIGIASDAFHLHKTTNSGENWTTLTLPGDLMAEDMCVLNKDTIWICNHEGLVGGAFLTTNGGLNWQVKYSQVSANPSQIYMYNARIGFIGNLLKTTDGGNSWFTIVGEGDFTDMYFIDSLTGWKCYYNEMKKTTDGGLNWINQPLPQGGHIYPSNMFQFSNINKDTIWGVGGTIGLPGNKFRGIIYFTSNGGNNWYFQVPDTSINIAQYKFITFKNKFKGWAYSTLSGIHTTTGGDTGFIMSINQNISNLPKEFILEQNYPNPFNAETCIKYKVSSKADIKIIVYNIIGKEITTLVNKKQNLGEYNIKFNASNLASGIYFYSLFVEGIRIDTKKLMFIK